MRVRINAGGRVATVVAGFALLVTLSLTPSLAEAAFPGANGKIAYDSGADGDVEIYVVNPDGTGKTQLTHNSGYDARPAWSPDGSKIAFACCSAGAAEVWVMTATGGNAVKLTEGTGFVDSVTWSPTGAQLAFTRNLNELWTVYADGTGETEILQAGLTQEPSWSPDGARIAIGYYVATEPSFVATVKPDGSNLTPITNPNGVCSDYGPDWSPDGAQIVFERENSLVTVNQDGSGQLRPCPNPQPGITPGESPAWSPDGTKIAFLHRPSGDNWEVHTANPDFTGEQEVTEIAPQGVSPGPPRGLDWQPVPQAYVRPKGAAPLRLSLVPAYRSCNPDQATLSHGSPLAQPSCASPSLASGYLTQGSPDANGAAANGVGYLRITETGETPIVRSNGDQADVSIVVEMTDVRKASDLSDYQSELQLRALVRITDRDNTPNPGFGYAATARDIQLYFDVPCYGTVSGIGSRCTTFTTAEALVPNMVKEAKRSIWELRNVRVLDAGADGYAETSPNTLFAVPGVFVP